MLTFLTPCRADGVKLTSGTRRIQVNNTLDERLRLLEDRASHSPYHDALMRPSLILFTL